MSKTISYGLYDCYVFWGLEGHLAFHISPQKIFDFFQRKTVFLKRAGLFGTFLDQIAGNTGHIP